MWEQLDNNTYVRKGVLEQVNLTQLDDDIAALEADIATIKGKLATLATKKANETDPDILDGLTLIEDKHTAQLLHLELTLSEKEALKQSING